MKPENTQVLWSSWLNLTEILLKMFLNASIDESISKIVVDCYIPAIEAHTV